MSEHGSERHTHCKECQAPLGAFSVHCDFCKRAIGDGEQRKRVRRVLFAFDKLLDTHRLRAPSLFAANAVGFGLASIGLALLMGVGGQSTVVALAAAAVIYVVVNGALGAVVKRWRLAEQRIIFEGRIRPLLEEFLRDRELGKERFDAIASSSLERVHPLHRYVPWR